MTLHIIIHIKLNNIIKRKTGKRIYIGGWGVSPTGKSFRFVSCVRACVRAVPYVWSIPVKKLIRSAPFPFPFWSRSLFPFPCRKIR